jgi:ribosomal protein S18 acetylase RimI-like enzyme
LIISENDGYWYILNEKTYYWKKPVYSGSTMDVGMYDSFMIRRLTETDVETLSRLDQKVFSGCPWHEEYVCTNPNCGHFNMTFDSGHDCRKTGGVSKRKNLSVTDGHVCGNCESPVVVAWSPDKIGKFFLKNMKKQGFLPFGAFYKDELAGYCLGYPFTDIGLSKQRYPDVLQRLKSRGIDADRAFYFSSMGVGAKFRRQKAASSLIRTMLCHISDEYGYGIYRTLSGYILQDIFEMITGCSIERQFLCNDASAGLSWYAFPVSGFRRI